MSPLDDPGEADPFSDTLPRNPSPFPAIVPLGASCLLVIPFYKDEERLAPYLEDLIRRLSSDFSIQIVDDGSGMAESRSLRALVESVRRTQASTASGPRLLPPLVFPVNRGKGAAVRFGWTDCIHYDFAGFVDADGAISAEEILRGHAYLGRHPYRIDGIIGSRVRMLGRQVSRKPLRHLIGRVFATAVASLGGAPIYDSQCGFKLFRSCILDPILPDLTSQRFSFDVELILKLLARDAVIHEFPIDWFDKKGSKVRLTRDALPMLLDVWRISRHMR